MKLYKIYGVVGMMDASQKTLYYLKKNITHTSHPWNVLVYILEMGREYTKSLKMTNDLLILYKYGFISSQTDRYRYLPVISKNTKN
jgi:hypothetical protein